MNPMITVEVAKAHRADLLREAHHERLAAEAMAARDPREAMNQPWLVTRLVAAAHVFLRVTGKAAPVEGR